MGLKKRVKNFFKMLTNIGREKWRKNAQKVFEDSQEYREQKNGGKKRAKKFFNHKNIESKKWILRNAPKFF